MRSRVCVRSCAKTHMTRTHTPTQTGPGAAAQAAAPLPVTPTHEEFLRRIAAPAVVSAEMLGWPAHMAAVIIAQACLESRWGGSCLAREANNLFGVKARAHEEAWEGPTTEYRQGVKRTETARFARYSSVNGAFTRHAELLCLPRYAAVRNARTPEAACDALQACGYATDPAYASKLKNMIRRYGFADPARLAAWSGYPAHPVSNAGAAGTTPSATDAPEVTA